MPVLASALFVTLVAVTAYGIEGVSPVRDIANQSQAAQAANSTLIPKEGSSGATTDTEANKMCPKPGGGEVYRSDKPSYPFTFKERQRTYVNLYGKYCEGPLIQAYCSKENFCDAKTFASSRCYFDGKWQACKTPENVQVAEGDIKPVDNGSATDASPSSEYGNLGEEPDDTIQTGSIGGDNPGSQQTNEAFNGGSTGNAQNPPVNQPTSPPSVDIAELGSQPGAGIDLEQPGIGIVQHVPDTSQPGSIGGLAQGVSPFGANTAGPIGPAFPGGSNNFAGLTPAPAPDTFGWSNPYGATERPRVGGFFNSEPQYPFAFGYGDDNEQPYFGNVLSGGLSMENTLRNFTDFVVNSFTSGARQPRVVEVQVVQPTALTRPPVLPRAAQEQVFLPSSNRTELSSTSSSWVVYSAADIGKAASGESGQSNAALRRILFEADRYAGLPIPDAFQGIDLSEPFVLTAATDTRADLVRQTFGNREGGVRSVQARPSSASQNPLERSSGIVDTTHSISIPELLSIISSGSLDLIREFAGRGSPDAPAVVTRLEGDSVIPVILGGAPTLPAGEARGLSEQRAPSLLPGISDTARRPDEKKGWDRAAFEERIRADATAIFQDSLPVLRESNYVPLVQPATIYPNVVPVPVATQAESDAPSFAELVVVNGVKEIKNLARTIWSFIVPSRE